MCHSIYIYISLLCIYILYVKVWYVSSLEGSVPGHLPEIPSGMLWPKAIHGCVQRLVPLGPTFGAMEGLRVLTQGPMSATLVKHIE